ncbi:hypothetical protein EON80_08295, partial [bacterium]
MTLFEPAFCRLTSLIRIITILCLLAGPSLAESPAGDVVGQVSVGYQGWFWAPGDRSPWTTATSKYFHFNASPGSEVDKDYRQVEMWPDVREYDTLFPTEFSDLATGSPARMFSSYSDQTVETHFKWMREAGIHAAALQRFGGEVTDDAVVKATRDAIAVKVMKAAEQHDVKFYIMYDCSGWQNFEPKIKTDWQQTIVNDLKLTESKAYARQNGKPVVCLWGLGYAGAPTTGPGNAEISLRVVNWFKANGYYVIGGFPGQWRSGTGDSRPDFKEVYSAVDMIAPWGVGGIPNFDWTQADLKLANEWGKDYQPMAYAGTSFFWGNRSGKNLFPRQHGDFMWGYFKNYRKLGIKTCYVAMFDEIDEGTAIFKVAEDATMQPRDQWFLALDADGVHCSADFYLRLTNDGGRMMRGELPYLEEHPTLHVAPASGILTDGTYELEPVSAPGKRLDITAGVDADGTTVQIWPRVNGNTQIFKVVATGNGLYEMAPLCAPSRRISLSAQNKGGVDIRTADQATDQRWKINDVGDGVYELQPGNDAAYRLENAAGNDAEGAAVRIAQASGEIAQRWRFVPVVASEISYQLAPISAPELRLDLIGGLSTNGTAASVSAAVDSPTQDWKITAVGNAFFELAPTNGGQRLDVNGELNAENSPVGAWQQSGSPAQKWRLLDIGGGIY